MEQVPNLITGKLKTSHFYAAHDTQEHEIGARYRMDDRVFHYAKAGATLVPNLGCQVYNTQSVAYATIAAAASIGDTFVVIDVAATDGAAGDGVIAKDELFGGYIIIFPGSNRAINRRIIGNTAVDTDEMTVELDAGIPIALDADTDYGECMASPYSDVRSTNSATKSIIGVPVVAATVGKYLWIQTWGPCWISPQAAVSVGNTNRQVVFRHDGSLDEHDYSDAYTTKAQHAGFVLANAAGATQGAAFIMLQICP